MTMSLFVDNSSTLRDGDFDYHMLFIIDSRAWLLKQLGAQTHRDKVLISSSRWYRERGIQLRPMRDRRNKDG